MVDQPEYFYSNSKIAEFLESDSEMNHSHSILKNIKTVKMEYRHGIKGNSKIFLDLS